MNGLPGRSVNISGGVESPIRGGRYMRSDMLSMCVEGGGAGKGREMIYTDVATFVLFVVGERCD